ncbi:hypothetical protein [Kitasatospora sp. GP82]|uniref:anti-sigma factor family protein n=1 Tax=Kitasatospora sp. GP82 TaxID=3035089 RepID=UPI002474BAE3|nr:hypothetical protein [Kitasatospora sp. GP82]MDH6127660.1 anti-sigma factor RsiW [Kitasatospora sp. GP82]
MTSRTPSWTAAEGADPHPDIDLLADLAEDLVAPDEVPALQRHLADCPDCAETYSALAEVRDLLGAAEAPPLPADVAERIDAALAAEAAGLRTPTPRVTQSEELSGPPAPSRSAPAAARSLSAPPRRPASGTGPDAPAAPGAGPGRSGRRRRGRLLLGAAAVIAVLGLGGLLVQQNQQTGRADGASAAATHQAADRQHPAVAPGIPVFQDDQLADQVHQLMAAQATPKAPSAAAQPEGANTPELSGRLPAAVPDCLSSATGHSTDTPLAVSHGRYGSAEVTALVYPLPDRPGSLDVYLVTPSCPGATVLLHRVLPAG